MYRLVQLECGLNRKRSGVALLAAALAYGICGAEITAMPPQRLFLPVLIHPCSTGTEQRAWVRPEWHIILDRNLQTVVEEGILIFKVRMLSPFPPTKALSVHFSSLEVISSQWYKGELKAWTPLEGFNICTISLSNSLRWCVFLITFNFQLPFSLIENPIWKFVLNNLCLCLVLYDFCVPTIFVL